MEDKPSPYQTPKVEESLSERRKLIQHKIAGAAAIGGGTVLFVSYTIAVNVNLHTPDLRWADWLAKGCISRSIATMAAGVIELARQRFFQRRQRAKLMH